MTTTILYSKVVNQVTEGKIYIEDYVDGSYEFYCLDSMECCNLKLTRAQVEYMHKQLTKLLEER